VWADCQLPQSCSHRIFHFTDLLTFCNFMFVYSWPSCHPLSVLEKCHGPAIIANVSACFILQGMSAFNDSFGTRSPECWELLGPGHVVVMNAQAAVWVCRLSFVVADQFLAKIRFVSTWPLFNCKIGQLINLSGEIPAFPLPLFTFATVVGRFSSFVGSTEICRHRKHVELKETTVYKSDRTKCDI